MQKFMCYCTDFALFYFEFEGNFLVQPPGLVFGSRGDLTEGGLYMEGLIFGILRYS